MHLDHLLTHATLRYRDRSAGLHVFDVAVIGVPDDRSGELVRLHSVEFVPGLPENAYGRIPKRTLRDRDCAEHARNA